MFNRLPPTFHTDHTRELAGFRSFSKFQLMCRGHMTLSSEIHKMMLMLIIKRHKREKAQIASLDFYRACPPP